MQIALSLQPAFLRSRQQVTRRALTGMWPGAQVIATDSTDRTHRQKSGLLTQIAKSRFFSVISWLIIGVSVMVGVALLIPQLYFAFAGVDTAPIRAATAGTPLGGMFEEGTSSDDPRQAIDQDAAQGSNGLAEEESTYIPPQDETLPEGSWIVIPRIGVRTELRKTENPEDALQKGVWHVPDYADPGDTSQPMILAAHRFGWEWWWQSEYWKYNSFYLLPDTEPGDIVEIIHDQRKWTYEIYAGEEGDVITDYDADMILYTCKFLNSPVRHFRYARVINPTANSQG